jgi:hypothetical protein
LIYCVEGDDLRRWFLANGFRPSGGDAISEVWVRPSTGTILVVPAPNVLGRVPENLLADAFDAAGVPPPKLPVTWCD